MKKAIMISILIFLGTAVAFGIFTVSPAPSQAPVIKLTYYEGSRTYALNYHDSYEQPVRKELDEWVKQGGHRLEEYTLPKSEVERWIKVGGKPVWDRWVDSMEAKGLPGKAVLADVLKLIESEPK